MRRLLVAAMVLVVCATACGGGSDASDDGSAAGVASTVASSPGDQTDAAEPDDDSSSAAPDQEPSSQVPSEAAWMGWSILEPEDPVAAADLDASIAEYQVAALELLSDDQRAFSLFAAPALGSSSSAPVDAAGRLQVLGESLTLWVDLWTLTERFAAVHSTSTDPMIQQFWEPRHRIAEALAAANLGGVNSTMEFVDGLSPVPESVMEQVPEDAHDLMRHRYRLESMACFVSDVVDGGCRDDSAGDGFGELGANGWQTALDAGAAEVHVDAPRALLPFERVCQGLDQSIERVGLAEAEFQAIWAGIQDSTLDAMFLGWSECRNLRHGEREASIDVSVDEEILAEYASAVLDAMVAGGYNEAIYDLGGGDDGDRERHRETLRNAQVSIVRSGAVAADRLLPLVRHPDTWAMLTHVRSIWWTAAEAPGALSGQSPRDGAADWDSLGEIVCAQFRTDVSSRSVDEQEIVQWSLDLPLSGIAWPDGCELEEG